MEKKELGRGMGYRWLMPELEPEIPDLFAVAGIANILEKTDFFTEVEVRVKKPLTVVNELGYRGIEGIWVNSGTYKCQSSSAPYPEVWVKKLPEQGDMAVVLRISLELLQKADQYREPTPDLLREALRKFAEAMNQTWHYRFKSPK